MNGEEGGIDLLLRDMPLNSLELQIEQLSNTNLIEVSDRFKVSLI